MAFKRRKKFQLDTLIDEDMIIRGNTTLSGGIRVDGKIYGNLTVLGGEDGTLVMGVLVPTILQVIPTPLLVNT